MNKNMCPHCGDLFDPITGGLIPMHLEPVPSRHPCPGSGQIPRCAESDARPLWNGEPNPHFGIRQQP